MIALGSDINSEALALSTVKLIFFLVLCFIIGIFLVPTFLRKITVFLNDEMLLLITIAYVSEWFCWQPIPGFLPPWERLLWGRFWPKPD